MTAMVMPPHASQTHAATTHAVAGDDHTTMTAKNLYASGFSHLLNGQYMVAHEKFLEVFAMLRGTDAQTCTISTDNKNTHHAYAAAQPRTCVE